MTTDMPRLTDVTVHLRDGRTIDLSHLTPDEAIELLHTLNVTPEMIDRTVHRFPTPLVRPGEERKP